MFLFRRVTAATSAPRKEGQENKDDNPSTLPTDGHTPSGAATWEPALSLPGVSVLMKLLPYLGDCDVMRSYGKREMEARRALIS
jgi:hypothetical protein